MVDIIPIDQIMNKIYWLRYMKSKPESLSAMCADTLNAFPMISCLSYHIKNLQV